MVKEKIKMDMNMKIQIKTERGYQPLLFCSKEKAEQIEAAGIEKVMEEAKAQASEYLNSQE